MTIKLLPLVALWLVYLVGCVVAAAILRATGGAGLRPLAVLWPAYLLLGVLAGPIWLATAVGEWIARRWEAR